MEPVGPVPALLPGNVTTTVSAAASTDATQRLQREREDRGVAILGEHVREFVETFLVNNDLLGAVELGFESLPDADAISVKPRASGAAELYLMMHGDIDLYAISIFLAGEQERPIEIAGPMNVNVVGPPRSAEQDLAVLLSQVARGDIFDELSEDGAVESTDVFDRKSVVEQTAKAERRRWYQPWA